MHILIALLANITNYYNYAIFGLCANYLAGEFFPSGNGYNGLSSFFGVLVFAVLVKPLSSIFFGTIGDLYGRSVAIKSTISASIAAMLIIALLPSFENIGYFAVALVLISRVLTLSSVTAEGDGMRIYVTEHLSKERVNLGNGMVTLTGQLGVLLASLAIFIITKYNFSFKLAFFLGAGLNLCVMVFRRFFFEPNSFMQDKGDHLIKQFVKDNWRLLLTVVAINGCIGGIYNFYIIFLNTYASNILPDHNILLTTFSVAVYALCAPLSGYLADKFGFAKQCAVALTLSFCLLIFCIFQLISCGLTHPQLLIVQVALLPFYGVPLQIYIKNKIPINARYRIFSMCHSLGSVFISTPTLFVANYIWSATGVNWLCFLPACGFILVLSLCAFYITCISGKIQDQSVKS